MQAVALAVLAAGTSIALAGCGGGGGGSATPSAGSDVTLTYWASNQGTSLENDKEVLTPVLEKFTEETGIKVNLEVIGWGNLLTKIQGAVASGSGADVVNIGNTWAASLQATGGFLPFDDAAMEAIGGSDKFLDTSFATAGAPGEDPASVPLYGAAYGLYYNKAMYADAGLTPPTTWEELVSNAKALTDTTEGVYGLAIAGASNAENSNISYILISQEGGSIYDDDAQPTFTTDKVVAGVSRYVSLMSTDKVVNPANAQYDSGQQAVNDFATGKAAMVMTQNNADASIKSNGMAADAYGVVPIPAPSGGEQISAFPAGINISVFGYTQHPNEALQLVKYMTSAETQQELDRPFAALPVLKDVDPTFTDDADEAKVFLDIYANRAKAYPVNPNSASYNPTVGTAVAELLARVATGDTVTDADIESALGSAEEQAKATAG